MTFQIIESNRTGAPLRTSPAIHIAHKQATITLTQGLLDELGVRVGDKVDVYKGTGPDAGSLMVVRGKSYTLTRNGPKGRGAKFGVVSRKLGIVNARVPTTDIVGFVADGKLFLTLPARLRADYQPVSALPSNGAYAEAVAAE